MWGKKKGLQAEGGFLAAADVVELRQRNILLPKRFL
jgi:hypothetical protein